MHSEYKFTKQNLLSLKTHLTLFRYSKLFNILINLSIIIYSLIVGIESYYKTHIPIILSIIDYSITIFFLLEILLKIYTEKNKLDFFKDKWNVFDFIVIILSLIPLNAFSSLAVARLLRIFRILRLITINEGVKKILVALEGAIPSILNILIIMFVIFYIYAILGTQFFSDINSSLWGNVSISLLTLFRILTFEDWTDIMYETMKVYPISWIYYVSFIILNAFIFFNLFVAIIVDEMSKIRARDIKNYLENDNSELQVILTELKEIKKQLNNIEINKGKNNE